MCTLIAGCREPVATENTRDQQAVLRRADRGEALIKIATSQLADLPAAVDTQLRPPTVILDSTKSLNRDDVLAVAVPNPNVAGNPVNIVGVPAQNARFKGIGVQSGDILKFYIVDDETVDEERRETGLARRLAKELTIAQVLDDSTLLIEGSLPEPVVQPAKMEVWRNLDDRLIEINEKLVRYAERRLPPVGWEPGPDDQVISQIVAWLNQWLRQSDPNTQWKRDPLLESLDPALASDERLAEYLSLQSLATDQFSPYDGRLLQEAVWLRDISRWAHGDDFNELARATALFDWTIRNIRLEADDTAMPHRPWRVLVDGAGTAAERAWVFALLCRQQGLDVVMLEFPQPGAEPSSPSAVYMLPALLLGDQLHLFDPRLGLPIPGPEGKGVATLAQVQQDDSLFRNLDVEGAPYPLTAEAAKNVTASVVASPFELSRRARQIESKLSGDNRFVLTVAPSQLAEKLRNLPGVKTVKIWEEPFRTLVDQLALGRSDRQREALAFEPFAMRPFLWKARMLHFQGRRDRNAVTGDDESINDHREAAQLYTSPDVRPSDREIAKIASPEERRVDATAKLAATYWLGLLAFDEGKYDVAARWFARPELIAPDSPWADGARYNLARTLEAQNKLADAAQLLNESESLQRPGNQLRAKRLMSQAEAAAAEGK